jgi:hypothetical protein
MTDEKYIIEKMIENIVARISEYRRIEPMEALTAFYQSETYDMLQDASLQLWELSDKGLFDVWLKETQKGNPRLSEYL